jgi:4-amino-4-deoxy-L-arabinose transferase-like glycosyltransferase
LHRSTPALTVQCQAAAHQENVMIVIAGGLILLTSLLITASLRLTSKPAALISCYLFSYANVVLAGEIANSFYVLNQQWIFLLLHFIFCAASGLWWWKSGKPSLAGPFSNWKAEFNSWSVRDLIKKWPDLALLALGIFATFAYAAVLNLFVPANNNDSLSTHLSRVGYWLQHGSFFPWPSSRQFQLFYPVNTQLQFLWTILFWGSDRLIGFIQWIAAVVAAVAVFGTGRLLGWKRAQSAFAALIFLSFPLILLQITTPQNDLVNAAFFASSVYFLLAGFRSGQKNLLLLSALSIGLGLGTKQTFYFLLPGIATLVLFQWKKTGKKLWPKIAFWAAACLVSFVLFTIYMNVVNWRYFGNPLGVQESVSSITGEGNVSRTTHSIIYNIPRYVYQMLDTSGLPRPLDGYAHKIKSHIIQFIVDKTGFQIEGTNYTFPGHTFLLKTMNINQEDNAWYGPLSVLLLFPAMAYYFIKGIRTREPFFVGMILTALIFLIAFVIVFPYWDPYAGRYFAPIVALCAPAMAGFFPADQKRRVILRTVILALALTVTGVTMLTNPAKQVAGKMTNRVNIWSGDRVAIETIQNFDDRKMLYMVDDLVPIDATLGLYTPGYFLDYPMFGAYFTRRLVPIYPFEKIQDTGWLNAQGIQYILVQENQTPAPVLPPGIIRIKSIDGWSLYLWPQP